MERFTSAKKVTVVLTEGEIEAALEAMQTLDEVLRKEEEDTGERLSSSDRHLLRVLDRAGSKISQALSK